MCFPFHLCLVQASDWLAVSSDSMEQKGGRVIKNSDAVTVNTSVSAALNRITRDMPNRRCIKKYIIYAISILFELLCISPNLLEMMLLQHC